MSASVPALVALALLVAPTSAARVRLRIATPSMNARGEPLGDALRGVRLSLARAGRTRSSMFFPMWSPVFFPVLSGVSATAWFVGMRGVASVPQGLALGPAVGLGVWFARRQWEKRRQATANAEPLRLAAGWDLLAVGMRAGLPVSVTLRAVSAEFTGDAANLLREVADLVALGADPVSAWEPALAHSDTAELARAARRTARTGSGLADVATDLAAQARASVAQRAEARSQRAAVWISAPLGLCFLPAFLCLGVLPVIVGMVHRVSGMW